MHVTEGSAIANVYHFTFSIFDDRHMMLILSLVNYIRLGLYVYSHVDLHAACNTAYDEEILSECCIVRVMLNALFWGAFTKVG